MSHLDKLVAKFFFPNMGHKKPDSIFESTVHYCVNVINVHGIFMYLFWSDAGS